MGHKKKRKQRSAKKSKSQKTALTLSDKQSIVKQFLTPTELAKKTKTTKSVATSWLKKKELTKSAESKISKLASEILAREKKKATRQKYKLPPTEIFFKPERLKRKDYKTKKMIDSDNIAFNVPDARTKAAQQKAEKWLDWARENGYTVRAIYKVGESGLGVDKEAYPSEIRSTSYIDLNSVSNRRYEQFKKSLTDDKGRFVKRFVIAQ